MSENSDEYVKTWEETRWLRIYEPPTGRITEKQEASIREFALDFGFEDLRGFSTWMRARGWDYYDVLRERYQ